MIGYSDVTAILLAIYAQTGIPTYYGPALVASFGEYPPFVEQTYGFFEELLMGDLSFPFDLDMPDSWTEEYIPWESQDHGKREADNQWVTVTPGKARGRLIGGNLNTMTGIWGSPYMPVILPGDILMIEDSLKSAATIERSFSLLKVNGVLDRVGGIILGKHELFDDGGTGRKPYEILMEVMGDRDIPVLAEFDSCHTHPMLTMPIGVEVEVDATNQGVRILSDWRSGLPGGEPEAHGDGLLSGAKERKRMEQVLSYLGKRLNESKILWGVGASLMLHQHGLADQPNDIDIFVSLDDVDKADEILQSMGRKKRREENGTYETKHFYEYVVDGVDVDLMVGLAISVEDGVFEYVFDHESITDVFKIDGVEIPFTSLEDWFVLYQVIPCREKKVQRIETYLMEQGIQNACLLNRALDRHLPAAVRERINKLLES
jgi:muramoyltetrapeptide carboxypeptidase LdcA involved in peptidoglycan recycling